MALPFGDEKKHKQKSITLFGGDKLVDPPHPPMRPDYHASRLRLAHVARWWLHRICSAAACAATAAAAAATATDALLGF